MSALPIDPAWDNQATDLNKVIFNTSPSLFNALSKRGKAIYFPKLGILSQSAEAKGKKINATIGIATEDDGKPMYLSGISSQLNVNPSQVFPYAPSPGVQELRDAWKARQFSVSPNLQGKNYSNPLVTHALTHGLSIAGFLFADEGNTIISPDYYWENYELTFNISYGSKLKTFPTFTSQGGFDVSALSHALASTSGKKIVILNFPNNPTGYTPTQKEMLAIADVLKASAAASADPVIVIVDDAYYGLCFSDDAYPYSIFGLLCDAHPNLIAVKVDGATKEDFVWGLRVGFISFGVAGATDAVYRALEGKTGGAIRGTISNVSHLSQSILQNAWKKPEYMAEKAEKSAILKARYNKVRDVLAAHPEYSEVFEALPYNSGYFMCVKIKKQNAEAVRQLLLSKYSTGLIAFGPLLRVAFSSTAIGQLEELFANLYMACKES